MADAQSGPDPTGRRTIAVRTHHPVMVFALRHQIHGENFSVDDVYGCMVTKQEHQTLVKLRTAPNVLIPASACERHQLLDVCLRRYTEGNVKLVVLPKRVRASGT